MHLLLIVSCVFFGVKQLIVCKNLSRSTNNMALNIFFTKKGFSELESLGKGFTENVCVELKI